MLHTCDDRARADGYSLGLTLNAEPCYVTSCDLFMGDGVVRDLDAAGANCVLTANTENRQPNSLNCSLAEDGRVVALYQGHLRHKDDPEAMGVFKISDRRLLASWRRECMRHSNLFCGQNLHFDDCPVLAIDKGSHRFEEINTVADYMRVLADARGRQL